MNSGQLLQHSVSAAFIIGILKALKQVDGDLFISLSDYLKNSKLSIVNLEAPTKRIAHEQLIELLNQIYTKSGLKRDIFIEIGQRLTASSFSALGYAATSCQSLGLAMATIPIYEKVAITMAVTQLKKSNGVIELTWGCDAQSYHCGLEEIILSAWVQLARNITQQSIQAEKVLLTGPIPQSLKSFTDLFGNSLEFNQKQSGIIFNENIMNLEVTLYDPYINELMNQQAQNLKDALSSVNSLYQSVSESVQQALISGKFSQEYIASLHNMSARTLRRG